MAEIVFYYQQVYRCKLSEEDYNKIVEYANKHNITFEDAYLQLENKEIDDYMDFANETYSEFIELEIND